MADALALIEIASVARGLRALDALVKKAPVEVLEANLVEPGKYLVLFTGQVACVEESLGEAAGVADDELLHRMLLPVVHDGVLRGLRGAVDVPPEPDTVGIVEGRAIAPTLVACDRSLKDADVALCGLRVAGGLGGRAYYVVHGVQHDVEAAIAAGSSVLQRAEQLHRTEIIPRPHGEMVPWLLRPAPFALS